MQSKRFPRLAAAPLTSHRTHVVFCICSYRLSPSCVKCMQVSLHCTEAKRVNAHVLATLSCHEWCHAVHTMTSLHSALTCVTGHHRCKEVWYNRCDSHLTELLHETFVCCREHDPNVAWQRCTHCGELHRLIRTTMSAEKARWCKECGCHHTVRRFMHASQSVTAADRALFWCALSQRIPLQHLHGN